MSFLSPISDLLQPVASQIPGIGQAFDSSSPAFLPNLPTAQNAFVNKYNTLQPILGNIDPTIKNSLIQFDMGRVNSGQNPLPIQQSLDAIRAASTGQAVTPPAQPQVRDFWSNSVRDVTQLADGILHIPLGLFNEGKKVVTEGPADLAKAFSAGNPLDIVHSLATTVPGIRDIPGAYTVGNLTGGAAGITNELTNPVFSALDVLPFAQKAAAGTDLFAAQDAERQALVDQGKFAPTLRPIRTVLTRTLDDEGNVIPNALGRAGATLAQTRPGQFINDMWSQEARQAARLEGQANIEYKQSISPNRGLPTTDPLLNATRDSQLLGEKYGVTPDRSAYLMQQASTGRADADLSISDTERAYLTDASIQQAKFTDWQLSNTGAKIVDNEFRDEATAAKLNAAQSKASSLQNKIQTQVLPKLQTSFDNNADPRIGAMIEALQNGDTAAANRIANGIYRGKTRLDAPQAVLTPPRFSASDLAPADATLGAIGGIRKIMRDAQQAEARLANVTAANPPARFMPLIAERAASAYAKTLMSRAPESFAPMTAESAADLASRILQRNTFGIAGFKGTELLDTINEVKRTWQDMRDQEGLNPTWFHRVTPAAADAAIYRGVTPYIPSVSQTKARLSDISPSFNDIGVSLSRQGMDFLHQSASENWIKSLTDMFGVNKADLADQYAPEAARLAAANPVKNFETYRDELINRTHEEFNPSQYYTPGSTLAKLDNSEIMMPKGVLNNLQREANPNFNKLSSITSPITNTFRTSVLPLSPRWMVYHVLGGAIMSAAASGLGAFKYIGEARQVLRDLASEDPELVAAAQDRISRPVMLGLGGMTRDSAEMNFRAATTMRRLFEEVGQNSPVAQRFKDAATAASRGLHAVTDRSYEINQLFDDTYRVMTYLNEYDKNINKLGMDGSVAQSAAIETARKIIHQWDEYTPIERQVLRQVLPFYGFTQHIMRFAAKYPFDHPIRADILSSIARNELQDQGTGLPTSFLNSFFFGGEDSMGNQKALSLTGINPFRDVANMMTLAGFARGTNPILSTLLQQLGIKNGQAELYPNLHYDPTSGQLTAVHDNPFVNFLANVIPQTQVLTALTGTSNSFKGLLASDPAAAKRALVSAAGLPVLYRNYNLPQEYFKAEVKRQAAQNLAKNNAIKSGDYSYAQQFPGLAALSGQVTQLQSSGQLSRFQPGNESQTNPAYAAQVQALTGG